MKFKLKPKYFLFMYLFVLSLDIISTFICLNFFGCDESHALPRFFFNLGWYGWIVYPITILLPIFLINILINKLVKNKDDSFKLLGEYIKIALYIVLTIVTIPAVINNFSLMG
jgi:uncharacterized membrane protein